MGHEIKDGRGSAVLARVTQEHLLGVHAVTHNIMAYHSMKGRSFCAPLDGVTMNTTEKKVGWLENNSDTHLLVVSCLTLSVAANAEITFYGGVGAGYTSGGSAIVPNNINAASGQASVVGAGDCYIGNDLVLTGQFGKMAGFLLKPYTPWSAPMFDSFILGRGNSFALGVKSLGSGGEAIEGAFRYWEITHEEAESMFQ